MFAWPITDEHLRLTFPTNNKLWEAMSEPVETPKYAREKCCFLIVMCYLQLYVLSEVFLSSTMIWSRRHQKTETEMHGSRSRMKSW